MRFEIQRQAMDEMTDWLTYYDHSRLRSMPYYISPIPFEKNRFAQRAGSLWLFVFGIAAESKK